MAFFFFKEKNNERIIIYMYDVQIKTKAAYEARSGASKDKPCVSIRFPDGSNAISVLPFPCVQCSDVDVHEHDRVWKNDPEVV